MSEKVDPMRLWRMNYRLTVGTIAAVSAEISALGLELKELIILDALDDHPHPAALSESLMIPKPSMTAYLKRLEAAGLVKREIDTEDLRRHRLSLTASGRKLASKGMAIFAEAFESRLSRLSSRQRSELLSIFEALETG